MSRFGILNKTTFLFSVPFQNMHEMNTQVQGVTNTPNSVQQKWSRVLQCTAWYTILQINNTTITILDIIHRPLFY
jgi:hypothetical protein